MIAKLLTTNHPGRIDCAPRSMKRLYLFQEYDSLLNESGACRSCFFCENICAWEPSQLVFAVSLVKQLKLTAGGAANVCVKRKK